MSKYNEYTVINLNDAGKEVFRNLGLGNLQYITISRVRGNDIFVRAGKGRFKSNQEEIDSWSE